MKIVMWVILGVALLAWIGNQREKMILESFANIDKISNESIARLEASAKQGRIVIEENRKRSEYQNWANTKTMVYVRAKSAKKCMEKLKIDILNNEVIECNKDHYVEVRNDELEQFKKDNDL